MLQTSAVPDTSGQADPTTRGVHHLELNTDDMKVTAEFYTEVLGMPLIWASRVPPGLGTGPANRGNPPFENIRHYFFDMGNDSILGFFESRRAQSRAVTVMRSARCSTFRCGKRCRRRQLMRRLNAHNVPMHGRSRPCPA